MILKELSLWTEIANDYDKAKLELQRLQLRSTWFQTAAAFPDHIDASSLVELHSKTLVESVYGDDQPLEKLN